MARRLLDRGADFASATGMSSASGLIGQIRAEPALDFLNRHALAHSVILDLVSPDLTDREISRFGMREVETANRAWRDHSVVFGECDFRIFFYIQQVEKLPLLRVIR